MYPRNCAASALILLFIPTLIQSLPISSGLALSFLIGPDEHVPIVLKPLLPDDSLPEDEL